MNKLILLGASWCPITKATRELFEEIKKEKPDFDYQYIDIDSEKGKEREDIIFSILIGFFFILILSFLTAFFAGENFLSRLKLNFGIIVGAILLTYFISYFAKTVLGIEI